jgi:predicted ATP-grasp superfamily ATP-dependent carboligase
MTEQIVVIAISGRALAQSAAKSGRRVLVLDAFADRDARAAAATVCIGADDRIALDPRRLLAALERVSTPAAECLLVIGSGFERSPDLLARLEGFGSVYANDADLIAALKAPLLSGELMRALGWEVPQTQLMPPADPRGWLQKEIGGAGGVHVRPAADTCHHGRAYYQRTVAGDPLSVTFLADGERAWVLGFNAQYFRAVGELPFCYAGAATCVVDHAFAAEVQRRLDRMVRVTGLRGLNGLDFLLEGADSSVRDVVALEVNPRPTATFELYEADFAEGLVHWHIRSFAGPLPEFAQRLQQRVPRPRAYRVLYAESSLQVPDNVSFADWCRDLPVAGSAIPPGAPVLSVFADGPSEVDALRLLEARERQIQRMLHRWHASARDACTA